ncbi:hypothetical protein RE438_13770 [Bacillus wiedmannii]|uniref:hypothetical protein n=1 Tax=Bacillus cereus group sp. N14 TaxID=2794587 RepID=UPI00065B7887|nr:MULTISPECIES: hypothetical protein [Bacillus cereus group]KMP76475.1 hypothetical protein TU62_09235 [Bacillus cereus]MBG9854254.1 hypothetical protein [Bacillus wiedmannii]MCQ6545613.1 hypothetical protein [Bacillus wiedmannii]MCQ6572305.1 hypothetical protein [Bacillus wiedmannii]MCU5577148.1 hypothetical protein [Bacillus wiedmannii]
MSLYLCTLSFLTKPSDDLFYFNDILMEKRLAELNNLKVGDKVKVQSGDTKKTLEVEIIGIYETNEQAIAQHTLN